MQLAKPPRVLEPIQWQSELQSVCGHFRTLTEAPHILGNVELVHKGQADFALVQHNAQQIVRNYRDIAQDGHAYYFLIIHLAGHAELQQGKSRAVLREPGDMTLIDSLQPSTFSYDPRLNTRQLSLHLPRELLHQHNPQVRFDSATLIRAKSDYGQLINAHVKILLSTAENTTSQWHLSNSLLELLCAQFARASYADELLTNQKTLQTLMSLLHEHALEDGFNVVRLAELSGLSTRSIQRLFAELGLHCTEMIQQIRVQRFAKRLVNTQRQGGKLQIATLAYEHGFGDVSTLNRWFKKYYGVSPKNYLMQAQGQALVLS